MSTSPPQRFRFHLHINQQQFVRYYQGSASRVNVISECGRRIQFPAMRLRPFLTHSGISGRFLLSVDAENRFLKLEKIS